MARLRLRVHYQKIDGWSKVNPQITQIGYIPSA